MARSPFRSARRALDRGSVGRGLASAHDAALKMGETELAKWCRLEHGGYDDSNPARGDETIPDYRTVTGLHFDAYGRPFLPPRSFEFINAMPVPHGVAELERILQGPDDFVRVHFPSICELIGENFQVEVYEFRFKASAVSSVLGAVEMELQERLSATERTLQIRGDEAEREDIVMISPNLYGVGFNLRALWRRFGRN